MNTIAGHIPTALSTALRSHLRNRKTEVVSIAHAIRHLRGAFPDIEVSDDDLEEAIAETVIDFGGNLAFDRKSKQQTPPGQS